MIADSRLSVQPGLAEAVRRSQDYFLRTQHPDGYWVGELETNVCMAAEYLLLTHFLGVRDEERWRKIATFLLREQRPDGTWAIYFSGPPDINATVESYFALKLAGVSPDDPGMRKARQWVLSVGGVPKTRVFTKIWLALLGQWDWRGVPVLPPELMFLPHWFPLNIYDFASWARATIVPMLIILSERPACPVPDYARIDELYPLGRAGTGYALPRPKSTFSWKRAFHAADGLLRKYDRVAVGPLREAAYRAAERWIVARQEADGSWGGIQPPWVYSLIALKLRGYGPDHPVMRRGLEGFEGAWAIQDGETFNPQACLSPVWDTALAVIALLDSGLSPDHPAIVQAGRWLLREQVLTGGDWQVKARGVEPGGWSFEFENDIYPDTDDTAEVLIALSRTALPEAGRKQRAIESGKRWLLGMQSANGGWGAFDRDNTRRLVNEIPFCDFGEVIDPPSADVTAHVIEALAELGGARSEAVRRGLRYLRREQRPDGSWFGRWGVNYTYGTGGVLPALHANGVDMSRPHVRRAASWLAGRQNEDGGWGETCGSYDDAAEAGRGPSTASQTAWGLMGLLSVDRTAGDGLVAETVARGVRYLVESQEEDGQWNEPHFTGTGFPGDFYIRYHLYRNYFPLMALGRYTRAARD
ncbi:MAG TPA: squalene--hopene cyclase [Dehalococcoidia bacterium]|nr:squalene--hopene cyclase [Dehalococcoidia bacterium]